MSDGSGPLVEGYVAARSDFLHERVANWIERTPDAPAVKCAGEEIHYAELGRCAGALATRLQALGITKGACVALAFRPSIEMVVAMLGVLRCGAVFLPLDPRHPPQRLQKINLSAEPVLILHDQASSASISALVGNKACIEDLSSVQDDRGHVPVSVKVAADDPCYLMYTSGSTGVPNGVRVTHGNVAGLFENVQGVFDWSEHDRWSALHSLSFGFSMWEIWGALTNGACLIIVAEEDRVDPGAWDACVRSNGISVLSLTPSGLRQWLAAECPAPDESLRLVVLSGEPLHDADLKAWYERFGRNGPALINTYALTETAGRVALHVCRANSDNLHGVIGSPTSDAEIELLNPVTLQLVSKGEAGELFVAGPMVAAGYIDNPELTAERFVHLDTGNGRQRRFYRSGDMARWNDLGQLEFAGRRDGQAKIRGHRVELAEVERVLLAHAQIESAAVVAVEHDSGMRLSAFAVPKAVAGQSDLEFWPSLGEYQVYDDLLYDFMSADEIRVASYRRAFERLVAGKVVLDIGTGKDAVLARLCAAAGARRVYAVEVLDEAAAQATRLVETLGLTQQITVLHGDMDTLQIPEPIEVCTQGIIGNIGSSDGIAPIWNAARRWFSESCVPVPELCTTWIAPARLPAGAKKQPAFGPLAAAYARRIFAEVGCEFDVRLCVRNFPAKNLLAEPAEFERLDFSADLPLAHQAEACFEVKQASAFDGYILWTRIHTDDCESVDFFEHQQAWLPVWLPLPDGGREVAQGELIRASWSWHTTNGQPFPDYSVTTEFADGVCQVHRSRHHETGLGQSKLHREIIDSLRSSHVDTRNVELLEWLRQQLPDYMVPGSIQLLPALPLSSNRKLDRQALQSMSRVQYVAVGRSADSGTQFEQAIAALWCGALGRENIGLDEEFFAVGGDSIIAVRLTTEVQRYLDDAVFLAGLYDAPTVARYCEWLQERHPESVARSLTAQYEGSCHDSAAELTPYTGTEPAPLTWAQRSLWFLQQLYPDNTGANEQFLIRTRNADLTRLKLAWRGLIERHDVLRTRIGGDGDQLHQEIMPLEDGGLDCMLELLDFSQMDDADLKLRQLARNEIIYPFDLRAGRLIRPVVVQMPDREIAVLVTAHHIVADGLCVPLIRDELCAAYEGPAPRRPELQFSDFARWQCERALDDWHQSELEWWREQLHGAETEPLAGVPSEVLSAGPEIRLPFLIPAKTADRLRQLAREENSTLFTVLLAGWRVWLGRCFDRHDFLIGSPTTLRQDEKTASMLGCLVNNVAFRNALDGQGTFREVLRGERSNVLSSLDHNTLPFELIVEDQQPSRFFGRHPLFQFMFQFDEEAGAVFAADGAEFTTDVLPVDRASYWDLELSVSSQGEGQPLQAFMGLRSDLFDAGSLSVWPEAICRMFELLAAAPDTSIGSVPLLSHAEATRLSGTLESTWPLPAGSLASLFVAQAARTPDAVAIRDAGGSVRYAALAEAVASRSALLASANVVAGDTVGVCMEPGVAAIATLLAINSRGASWLPLDPAYPQERLQHMVEDAAPKLVITDQPGIPWSVQTLAAADSGANAGGSAAVSGAAYPDAEVACILFTSGSTGVPKGSLLTQAAVLSRCLWMWEYGGFEQSDTFVQRTSLNFVDSIWEIFGPLLHGATVAVPPTEIHSDTARLADWICSASANHLVVVPALLNALLDEWQQRVSPLAMRSVITSGEAISSTLVQRFRLMLPNCQLLNTYGTSENWDITCARIDQLEPGAIVPAGWPVANTGVRILDAELRPLPPGLIGELYVSGIGANGAYLNREELTAQRFIHYPAEAGEKLFRTGDLAYWDQEGCIYLQGRADRQFKIRGIRVEPAEIEAVVNCLPGIDQSAVVLHEANKEDSVTAWMGLYVVAKRGASVRLAELREQLHACLPAAWVAADIVLVESIPRTPSGKLDVGELLAASDAVKSQRGAPATPTERQLVGIWVESLGLKDVGVNDDFFASRGNSLLATRMIARICDAFGVDLPLAALFESPTVAGLAGIIDALRWAAESPTPDDAADVEREVLRL